MKKRIILLVLLITILFPLEVFANISSFSTKKVNGININSVELNMNSKRIKPVILNANNQMLSTESLESMAKKQGAFAAINGTYFSAYEGLPVPWGTIIKNGKFIHTGSKNPVVGITDDGKLVIDRLTLKLGGYVNGELKTYPWRINHPSTEPQAITVFTPEYGTTVNMEPGAKAVLVSKGYVSQITTSSFNVPSNGFAMVFNSSGAHFVDQFYNIGDQADYKVTIETTFTDPSQWEDVTTGLGVGPSLIINGVITADGLAEGFTEDKININRSGRSFIGAKADGTIIIGNMNSATLKEAAEACKQMGLINAMCLDGGGSISLYYQPTIVSMAGRNLNNGLGFVEIKPVAKIAKPTTSKIILDGRNVDLDAYNIEGNNYFKLRDIAMMLNSSDKNFNVVWDGSNNAINLQINQKYIPVGGELKVSSVKSNKNAASSNSNIYIDNNKAGLKAFNIDNNNYFNLRDVLNYLNIEVIWDAGTNSILINTN